MIKQFSQMSKMMKMMQSGKGKNMLNMMHNFANSMILLDGKKLRRNKKSNKGFGRKSFLNKRRPPHLAAILVGNDGASLTYIGSKIRS